MSKWKNQFNTTNFQDFMNKFFLGSTLIKKFEESQIFNKKLIISIDQNKNAEITLSTLGTVGHYEGFKVTITHKVNGEIARQWFGFKEYLSDGYTNNEYPHIIEYCQTDWYMNGATPDSIKSLTGQIHDYINFYK